MMKKKLFLLILIALTISGVSAQERRSIKALFTEEPFEIDGKLNEPQWGNTEVQSSYIQNFPTDSLPARRTHPFG